MMQRPAPPAVDGTAAALCRALVVALRMDGAAVTARGSVDNGHLVFATDDLARSVDELHLTLNEGPAIDAFLDRSPFAVPDLAAPVAVRRWPVLTREAGRLGVAALFAYPLQVGTVPFGTVQLHRRAAGALTPADTTSALLAAETIARTVLQELNGSQGRAVQRDDIAIATGIIAVQAAVSVTGALALLRAAAFAEQTPIRALAAAVVDRTRRFH